MRQRIGTKLTGGFLISAAITMLVGVVAIFILVRVNNSTNTLLDIHLKEMDSIQRLQTIMAKASHYETEFVLYSQVGNLAKREEYRVKLEDAWAALIQNAEAFRSLPLESGIREHTDELVQSVAQSGEKLTVVKNLMLAGRSYAEVQPQYLEYRSTMDTLEDVTGHIYQHSKELMLERHEELVQLQATLKNFMIAIVVVAVILAILGGMILTRSITRPVSRLSEVTKKITAGDLTQRAEVTSKDELGELATSFNQMTGSLQKSRDEIQEKNQELEAQNEELRATEEELRSAKEGLEYRVKERTADLEAANEELQATEEELRATNEELRETQEQLVRSEKLAAIGQLAGGVGHELRNPLGAIKNAAYYIKEKVAKSELAKKEPRVLQFLEIMDDEINASNKIINDLLGFSRVSKPSVSPTRIKRVIEDALSRLAIPENIEVVKKLDTELPEVEIDPDQIQQVLVNVVTNAVQAMPEGGTLTISAKEKEKFLEVEIADTGCGIPEEVRNKIFDPLFTTRAKGIGLGLAVCKAIIERHEGYIEVESEVGKGTTFNIKLPLKAA